MNFEQFTKLERITDRAVNAAKTFAEGEDVRYLNELSSVVAELRHAAQTLCDRTMSDKQREEASMRLHQLFSPF